MKQIKCILILILFLMPQSIWAQQQGAATGGGKGLRRGVAAVMFATIGGAVLGLSTLSFYGHPQEHTGNITTGALIGLAAGVGYVSYNSSQRAQPSGAYEFSETELRDLKTKRTLLLAESQNVPIIKYQLEF